MTYDDAQKITYNDGMTAIWQKKKIDPQWIIFLVDILFDFEFLIILINFWTVIHNVIGGWRTGTFF